MKPRIFFLSVQLLALAFLLLVGACSKKDEDSKPAATSFSWTADNTNYTATTATATVQGTTMSLDATATSSSNSNGITISVPAMAGTYTTMGASSTVNYSMFYFINAGNASVLYMASNGGNIGSGTVTVTTFSATDIVGTFSFTGSTLSSGLTKDVTNGKFSIKR
jgi:hypothetical protein